MGMVIALSVSMSICDVSVCLWTQKLTVWGKLEHLQPLIIWTESKNFAFHSSSLDSVCEVHTCCFSFVTY